MKFTGDRCQCRTCAEYFNSTRAFDKHRTGTYAQPPRRCLSPDEMRARGMSQNAAGFWITSRRLVVEIPAYVRNASKGSIPRARTRELAAIGSTPCTGSPPAHDRQNVADTAP